MATEVKIKPVFLANQRRSDGTFNVKIRFTFKRQVRYIATDLSAGPRSINSLGELCGTVAEKADRIAERYRGYIGELNYFALRDMDIDGVMRYVERRIAADAAPAFRLDFFEFAEKEIQSRKISRSSVERYHSALASFRRYLGRDYLDINEITKSLMMGYHDYVEKTPKASSIGIPKMAGSNLPAFYISLIGSIYRAARDAYNDEDSGILVIPRDPFSRLRYKFEYNFKRTSVGCDVIQRMISARGVCTGHQNVILDIYLLSFATMGMNLADLMTARAPKNGVVIYNRQKTAGRRADKAEMHVKIDERIKPLYERLKDEGGAFFTRLHKMYSSRESACPCICLALERWAKANGIPRFTFYSARHTWATLARSSACGIDKGVIDDCLCHLGGNPLVDVYAEKDWSVLWRANEKVLDLFDWSALKVAKNAKK